MKYLIIILAVLLFYICLYAYGVFGEKRKEKLFKYRLRKEYGSVQYKEYSEDRKNSLKGYFNKHIDEVSLVDDISWNDIDGERLFQRLNYCYSSIGEEYLYYRLRHLKFSVTEEERSDIEERLLAIDSDEKERLQVQFMFAKLGRCGKYSIFQYIDWLNQIKKKPVIIYWLCLLVYPACFALFGIEPSLGVLSLAVVISVRILLHVKERKEIEPYILSLAYLIRTLQFADKISKNSFMQKVWPQKASRIKELRKQLKGISSFHMIFLQNSGESLWDGIMIYLNSLTGFDMIAFFGMLKIVEKYKEEMDEMISLLGQMEADISIASFRKSLPHYCVPEFCSELSIRIDEAIHPMIIDPVSNSFAVHKGMLLTGSNASGKSTFLKTVEIAAILAQTIQTVPAKSYCAPFFRVYSSMSLRDSLLEKESYYIVEIKAIKRILDALDKSEIPVLCFVDEVLRGTNTIERISAASEILREFSLSPVMCFAATHDIELTKILAGIYDNYHFEELVTNEDVSFPYKLLEGPAQTRNAIKLLQLMSYPERIIEKAENRALSLLAKKVDLDG